MLDHMALGMHPLGFNGIEPGRLSSMTSPFGSAPFSTTFGMASSSEGRDTMNWYHLLADNDKFFTSLGNIAVFVQALFFYSIYLLYLAPITGDQTPGTRKHRFNQSG
jgi:hypothetical protein